MNRLAAAYVALGAILLASHAAKTQEHVSLVPQLGMDLITSVAFSRDGHFALTGSNDKTARVWDVATGVQIRSFAGHAGAVTSVAFSPDGRVVLTGSWDKTARLWDTATGRQLQSFVGHGDAISSVAFSPDGRMVLTGSYDATARLWDAASGRQIRAFSGHTAQVNSVAFSPDGRMVLTGAGSRTYDDMTARLWDVATGRQIRSFEGHKDGVSSVAFSPDGRSVLTGSYDSTLRVWETSTGRPIRSFEGSSGSVDSFALAPDGKSLLVAGGKSARLLSLATGLALRTFAGTDFSGVAVAFSPDGRSILTVGWDKTARLTDVATGRELRVFAGHTHEVFSAALSLDGRLILTRSGPNSVRLWDTATGQQVRTLSGHADTITSAVFSSDSRFVLTGSDDKTARLWDVETGQTTRIFSDAGVQSGITSVAFSPAGREILTDSWDLIIRLWDISTGHLLRSFEQRSGNFSAEKARAAAAQREMLGRNLKDDHSTSVAFSPDGRRVVTSSWDNSAELWDAATGKPIRSFAGHTKPIYSVAFSPDGHQVLTGSYDNTARLWDADTGQPLRSFIGHTGVITSVAFPSYASKDGRTVLTASADGTARLWDSATGRQIRSLEGHSSRVTSATFSSNGSFVLTSSWDTTTRLWDATSGKQLAALVSFDNGGWAVADPEGRFDTNDLDGGAPLVWVADRDPMRALPLEIFMRDYYTPRLLSRILSRERFPQVRSIGEIHNWIQPEVSIVSATASKIHPGRADVVVHAASRTEARTNPQDGLETASSGLQDLRLFRNGQLVANTPQDHPLKTGDYAFHDIQLPASEKGVTFTAYAFSTERIKSSTAQREIAYQPSAAVHRRAWLLQVGVNHYHAQGCELQGSVTDAEQLSKLLMERLTQQGLDVRAAILVSDGHEDHATKAAITASLKEIAAKASPDDVFFLSFSGHGFGDAKGLFHIFPADIEGSCAAVDQALLKNAISADELAEWLRPIDAGEMTFVLDSCQSASSVEANDFKPGPMGSRGLGQLAYDKRMRILAASQSNQAAHESSQLHQGLLSFSLTQEGLVAGKADWKPVDQKITIGEWLSYAAHEVPLLREAGTVKTGRGIIPIGEPIRILESPQIPAVFDFSLQDTFVLQRAKAQTVP